MSGPTGISAACLYDATVEPEPLVSIATFPRGARPQNRHTRRARGAMTPVIASRPNRTRNPPTMASNVIQSLVWVHAAPACGRPQRPMVFSTSILSARPIIAVAHNRQRARADAPVDLQTKAYVLA